MEVIMVKFGKYTTKMMRKCRDTRTNDALRPYEEKLIREQKEERIAEAHHKMDEVMEFFEGNYKGIMTLEKREKIEESYRLGTKSQYGMILLLDKLFGDEWPEWRKTAMNHFNIEI